MKRLIVSVLFCGLFAGCATTRPLQSDQLPKGAQVVAGGLMLDWNAPRSGTAILLEATTGKTVKSESLNAGDHFSFNPLESDNVHLLNSLFSAAQDVAQSEVLLPLPKNARFLLLFAPAEPKE